MGDFSVSLCNPSFVFFFFQTAWSLGRNKATKREAQYCSWYVSTHNLGILVRP